MHEHPLTAADLARGWREAGVHDGMTIVVHSSLSSLGRVEGGAATVVESLLAAVGPAGNVVVPTFTPQVTDPEPEHSGVPDTALRARRDAVPAFHPELPSPMGAVPEALRSRPDSVRGGHPQVSLAAVGPLAADIVRRQTLGFAVGRVSPFGRLHELGAHILLIGVGHNRNTFLHYAETLTPHPRLKLRRFPMEVDGERVWAEALDVGDDNSTHFPTVGGDFEAHAGIKEVMVGAAACRLLPVRELVPFAVRRLTELLAA
ncbi:AAC(3) family N-acetyltransferase [Nonomuraea sp. NN258]|uniref:aminoglycoside N(3)-acetyltransferase n=1 Tax=Nonomuraea antri TaxID=2730852 RepID=UPI00156842F8|nr:AAC(3) family N-acetyltransferase [Nonomuraea antri]NRQ33132.1 AAC(3) family N-acetyltransferase [Nonomuraea antri]